MHLNCTKKGKTKCVFTTGILDKRGLMAPLFLPPAVRDKGLALAPSYKTSHRCESHSDRLTTEMGVLKVCFLSLAFRIG